MAMTEEARLALYDALRGSIGEGPATTMMEALPPVGWADVATKQDLVGLRQELAAVEERLGLRMDAFRAELRDEVHAGDAALRTEMHTMRGDLRTEMQTMRGDLRTEMQTMRGDLHAGMASMQRTLVVSVFGAQAMFATLVLTAVSIFG